MSSPDEAAQANAMRAANQISFPANADRALATTDWLPPVPCPRCGGTGKEPNP